MVKSTLHSTKASPSFHLNEFHHIAYMKPPHTRAQTKYRSAKRACIECFLILFLPRIRISIKLPKFLEICIDICMVRSLKIAIP